MVKLQLKPQTGTITDSKNISFEISGITSNNNKLTIENSTHSVRAVIKNIQQENGLLQGIVDLNIPETSTQSAISILGILEEGDSDKTYKMLPALFYIKQSEVSFKDKLTISPAFINLYETTSIKVLSKPNIRLIFSINDKRFPVTLNSEGIGSIHFKGIDAFPESDSKIANKFPIHVYTPETNYNKKEFTGLELTILPSDIKTQAIVGDIDPRCELPDPWVLPDECKRGGLEDPDPDIFPRIPASGIPTKRCSTPCSETDTFNNFPVPIASSSIICRINDHSSTLINNGMVLHTYTSVSKEEPNGHDGYNISKVFIAKDESSLEKPVISVQDAVIYPHLLSVDPIQIQANEVASIQIKDLINAGKAIYAVIFDERMVGTSLQVISVDEDSYSTSGYLITTESGKITDIFVESLYCQYVVFYDNSSVPTINLGNYTSLPYIRDNDGVAISATKSIIVSNPYFLPVIQTTTQWTPIYIIAEASINGNIQLFLYTLAYEKVNANENANSQWQQLTFDGENKNPKAVIDKYNNLHIVWESNRDGNGDYQLYYGAIGPSSISLCNSALSSIIDKQAELNISSNKPDSYFTHDILVPKDEYYTTYNISKSWQYSGTIDASGESVTINGQNPTYGASFASTVINEASGAGNMPMDNGLYDQLNFQIGFNVTPSFAQPNGYSQVAINQYDKNALYETWKSGYTLNIAKSSLNSPIYSDGDNNDFVLGFEESVYDRFVPMVGSYKITGHNPAGFKAIVSGTSPTLRPFMLGIIPEKMRLKATNTISKTEYEATYPSGTYVPKTEVEIYTGNSKLILLYNSRKFDSDSSYAIVRNISDNFPIWSNTKLEVIVHYSKMLQEDIAAYFDLPNTQNLTGKFLCSVTILQNTSPIFSESFITDLGDSFRAFDIGFGFPSGGQYIADEYIPYNSSIFENNNVSLEFTNINITSPLYMYNSDVCSLPNYILNQDGLLYNETDDPYKLYMSGTEDIATSFYETDIALTQYKTDLGISNFVTFPQIPITLSGSNKSADICLGVGNDVHIAWQSNRNKFWNIYTTNSYERNLPFRKETEITTTESNSLCPNINVSQNGKRMIVWHDDRNGKYEIFAARAVAGQLSKANLCSLTGQNITPINCIINTDITSWATGKATFIMQFYQDSDLMVLYKEISTEDGISGWNFLHNGNTVTYSTTPPEGIDIIQGEQYSISYEPSSSDGVFDMVLYCKLIINIIKAQ